MNKIVRIGEDRRGAILDKYFPAIVKWRSSSRAMWQKCMGTGSINDFRIFMEIGQPDKAIDLDAEAGWWFNYQRYVEIEFEDGTIKLFETKNNDSLADDPETFKEFVEFIDNYVNNGFEIYDETALVLDDEDDLLVV